MGNERSERLPIIPWCSAFYDVSFSKNSNIEQVARLPVHVMTVSCFLRNPGDAHLNQKRIKEDYLNGIIKHVRDTGTSFGEEREIRNVLLIQVTSNRGLTGAFNANVNKALASKLEEEYMELYEAGKVTILPIGKKGRDYFSKRYPMANFIEDNVLLFDELTFAHVSDVAQYLRWILSYVVNLITWM